MKGIYYNRHQGGLFSVKVINDNKDITTEFMLEHYQEEDFTKLIWKQSTEEGDIFYLRDSKDLKKSRDLFLYLINVSNLLIDLQECDNELEF